MRPVRRLGAVLGLPEVLDSLVVGLESAQSAYYMPLFVVLRAGLALDESMRERIRQLCYANT